MGIYFLSYLPTLVHSPGVPLIKKFIWCGLSVVQLQVHNLDWEVAFGHVNGYSPQQSLCLFLELGKIPSELMTRAQHEWNSDTIMADFVDDGFLQMMDDINQSMDSVPTT